MRKQVLALHSRNFVHPKPVRELGKVYSFIQENVQNPYLREELRRQLRAFENKINFSSIMKTLVPQGLAVYDLDSIPLLILKGEEGEFRGIRIIGGAFELKWKSPRTVRGSEVRVNGWQFRLLSFLASRFDVELWYFINAGWNEFLMFNVNRVVPDFRIEGSGPSRDYYAVIDKDEVIRMRPWEVVDTFKLLFAEEVV